MRPSRRQSVVAVFSVLALLVSGTGTARAEEPQGLAPPGTDLLARDSWIVTLVADADAATEAPGLAQAAGGQVGAIYHHALDGFQLKGSPQAAAALERNPRVVAVQADTAIHLTETLPFGIERVQAYEPENPNGAYQQGFRGSGARIAILDTGIDLDHPDLVASIDNGLGRNCLNAAATPNDGYGHGTHVAGTAAAPRNNVGVVGVAPDARLVAVKMFDDAGNSSQALALCALDHIIGLNADADPANDVHVANMSWGEQRAWGDCSTDLLHGAICRADAAGIILVAGAGNSAVNAGSFVPAAYPEVISVSALADFDGERGGLAGCGFVLELFTNECDDSLAFFSNYGPVDVIAPGVQVQSTWAGGGWKTSSGTSMASPHVAGIAALMAAAAPALSPADARAALLTSGECPNGQVADADGVAGCGGQGTWRDDRDATPEPMGHALRAAQAVVAEPPAPEPPSAPTLSSATATTESVELSWTAPASDGNATITGYQVYRGTSSGSATLYATVGAVLTYTDTGVAAGETYWYEVSAANSAGSGPRSNEVSATIPETPPPDPDPPSAPALSATAGDGSATLSWTAPTDDGGASVTGYEIHRGTASGSETLLTTVGPVLTHTDTGLANGTTYWYEVAAINSAGAGARSNEVSATPLAPTTKPSVPLNFSAHAQGNGIRLSWAPPASDGGSPITAYRVYRGAGAEFAVSFQVSGSTLSFLDTTVARRTWYTYIVTAVNAAGEGPPTDYIAIKSR